MAEIEVKVKGLRELEAAMQDFPARLQKQALDAGLREFGKVVVEEIRVRAADDALIANAMRIRQSPKKRRTTGAHLVIGWLRRTGAGARVAWREFGTQAHTIKPKPKRGKKALVDPETGAFFGSEVQHPGQRARPFVRPALTAAAPRALEAMRLKLAQAVARTKKRLAKAG